MTRFYKNRFRAITQEFTQIMTSRCRMWTHASKIVSEAAQNRNVVAVGTAVIWVLAWKALGVYDTKMKKDIAEVNRVAEDKKTTVNRTAKIGAQNQIAWKKIGVMPLKS